MTRIDFHSNITNKLEYACRIIRKAMRTDHPVVVYCSDTTRLHQFDQTLWTFSPLEFIPHCYMHESLATQTPVLLTSSDQRPPTHQILINLDTAWPPFFSEFERLIEIVSNDATDLQQSRARYKFYRERGYTLNNFSQGNL